MANKNTILSVVSLALLATGVYLIVRGKQSKNNTTMQNDPRLPRGYRNNNPLNIRKYPNTPIWQGEMLPNTDGTFVQFRTMPYGYRAAFQTMRTYKNNHGLKTLAEYINRWAPTNENNTTGYINRVCRTTGFVPATVINPYDKEQMVKLIYAMAIVENGIVASQPVMAEIEEGWRLL